jgi:hypothetical protein
VTSDVGHDASADGLDRLMALAPDPDRAERVRVRCRTQLGRSRRRAARSAVITGFAWRVLGPVVVGAFCVLYVAVLVVTTLRLESVFH